VEVISPGGPAPDFSLRDQDGNRVGLSEFAGRRLVLAFYPADFSPGCTDQLSLYQEIVDEIEAQNANLVGVSVDSVYSHRAFRRHLNLTIRLLADFHPKGEMSRAYGAYLEDWGTTNRSLVLVSGDGVVRWSYAAETPKDIPGANLIFDALANAD
jgi:peroxiredoxin